MKRLNKKLSYALYILLCLVFTACSDGSNDYKEVQRTFCTCDEREKMAEWLTDNMQKANNMSDEEMEDVIRQLQRTAVFMFCHTKNVKVNKYGTYDLNSFKLDSCEVMWR